MSAEPSSPAATGSVAGFDHIALPLQNVEAMVAFYRELGLTVDENAFLVQVHLGNQMINFHKPEIWQGDFALRAPAARPPCGDICFVWEGSTDAMTTMLLQAGVDIIEGPVPREGGRRKAAVSHYVRDPDGNLLEFMQYASDAAHA
jgi:catechol 2,3-dioxygenase-like lactoylglutathione lyase family enzyme